MNVANKNPTARYFEAYGQFIFEFTQTERMMAEVLWLLAGVENEVARAVLSGSARIDASMELIRRVLRLPVRKLETWETLLLKHVMEHISDLAKVRNSLIHHGATFTFAPEFAAISSNSWIALPDITPGEYRITLALLRDMSSDLRSVQHYLQMIAYPRQNPVRSGTRDMSFEQHEEIRRRNEQRANMIRGMSRTIPYGQRPTWRYSSPEQLKKAQKTLGREDKSARRRRRKSSHPSAPK
jgi:hypothetical protein